MKSIVGIILAGGQSRRFGTPKAFAKRNEIPFYQYSLEALQPFVFDIILVTNAKLNKSFKEHETTFQVVNDMDKYQGQGPLAGIYTAMERIESDWYIVLPVDVPFVESWVFNRLITNTSEHVDAIVPVVDGQIQPLFALYNRTIKQQLVELLDNHKRSMKALLDTCVVTYVKIDDQNPFININDQNDYQIYIGNSKEEGENKK